MFEGLFSRRGLSVDRLRVLCEVGEAGSITRAAGGDPVRQSQFSRQLKELEDFFGVELTRRQGKGLVLTEDGKELVLIARETIGRLNDFQLRASNQPLTFSIGGGDSLLHWLVLPRLAVLQKGLPNLTLRLQNERTAEIIARLQEASLDFGIVRRDVVTEPLAAFPIGKLEYALFCPKGLFKGGKPPALEQVLATIPLSMQTGDGEFMRQFRQWREKSAVAVSIKLECDSFPQACKALSAGLCVAVLPTIARCDLSSETYWELALPQMNKRPRQLCLAWNPRTLRRRGEAVNVCEALKAALKMN